MDIDNLGYFFAGLTIGYAMRVVGIVITLFEGLAHKLIRSSSHVNQSSR